MVSTVCFPFAVMAENALSLTKESAAKSDDGDPVLAAASYLSSPRCFGQEALEY